jgi:YegS/Rv2252/BmrU family lipid kinase
VRVIPLTRPGGDTTCVLIRNPAARRALDDATLARVLEIARAAGWRIECATSEYPQHPTQLAREAAHDSVDVVLVHGGDGTLNEAANGIAGTDAALAVLPGGTANVWAKELRIPRDPVKAMRTAAEGERRQVDLGRANGRYFMLMAGVGLDAAVIERVRPAAKRRWGALSYIMAALPEAFRARARPVRLRLDGEDVETDLYWMVVGNTRSYGGFRDITVHAVADDGLLDVALMSRGGVWRLLLDGARVLAGRHEGSPNVRYVRAREIVVVTDGLPVQIDGEPVGETPTQIDVAPRALNVIVPRGLRTPLFSATAAGVPREGDDGIDHVGTRL